MSGVANQPDKIFSSGRQSSRWNPRTAMIPSTDPTIACEVDTGSPSYSVRLIATI